MQGWCWGHGADRGHGLFAVGGVALQQRRSTHIVDHSRLHRRGTAAGGGVCMKQLAASAVWLALLLPKNRHILS